MSYELVYFVRPRRIEDFEETFTAVAQAGISTVVLARKMGDLNFLDPADVAKAKEILTRLDLKTPAIHGLHGISMDPNLSDESQRQHMIDEHIRLLEHAAEFGCLTYVCHPGSDKQSEKRETSWNRVRDWLDAVASRAESLGITIALENANPGNLGDNAQKLRTFVEAYDCPAVRTCFDSGHAHRAEEAPAVLETLSPFVVTVHLHDNDKSADQHRLPGNGTIDWKAVIPLLKKCPLLKHVETEPFNEEEWDHKAIYDLYRNLIDG